MIKNVTYILRSKSGYDLKSFEDEALARKNKSESQKLVKRIVIDEIVE